MTLRSIRVMPSDNLSKIKRKAHAPSSLSAPETKNKIELNN